MTHFSDQTISRFQTKIDVAEMESLQRHPTKMEGENPVEQCHLAMLAHAV